MQVHDLGPKPEHKHKALGEIDLPFGLACKRVKICFACAFSASNLTLNPEL